MPFTRSPSPFGKLFRFIIQFVVQRFGFMTLMFAQYYMYVTLYTYYVNTEHHMAIQRVELNDGHGERFHQDIAQIEKRYRGKDSRSMLTTYCGSIRREARDDQNIRKTKRQNFSSRQIYK